MNEDKTVRIVGAEPEAPSKAEIATVVTASSDGSLITLAMRGEESKKLYRLTFALGHPHLHYDDGQSNVGLLCE